MGVHESAARALKDLEPELVCGECGSHRPPSVACMADYLGAGWRGWSECCGYSMEIVTAKQRAEGYKGRFYE